ncbi:MAG: chemotaxis protein CheW [Proteobacteria bacterium]|nr:chemotaxis protein CheW [Pseudomonadota bacterium]
MGGKEIDWNQLHQRMAAANAMIAHGWIPSPAERKRILKERAELLAVAEEKQTTEQTIEIVEFLLAREHYGIESSSIREVYPLKDYTPLPGVPSFVLGLMNVRGRIISVVDIKRFFDMPEKGISNLNKVIIINDHKMELGILADEILGVRNIAISELDQPLPTLTGILEKFVRGVTGECLVVLDAARILADQNIVVHEEV